MTFAKKIKNMFPNKFFNFSIVILIILSFICLYLWGSSIKCGAEALISNYGVAFAEEREEAYQRGYDHAFEQAEEKYHTSNFLAINMADLEEVSRLEVLKASDVEFVTEDRDNNSGNVVAWLEVTGEGTFTVDLQVAEFIVDNQHQYVLVRVPYPELGNVTITEVKKLLFKDDWLNGSYSEGVDLALKQRNEASLRIQKALRANQYIYEHAQAVAESTIINLVKQFNPGNSDLIVEVEFVD